MKNNLERNLISVAFAATLITGCSSAAASPRSVSCSEALPLLGIPVTLNPNELITDPTRYVLPHELGRAALLTGMNQEDRERVNTYLTNESPFTEGEGLLLTTNQGFIEDLEPDAGMIMGSATIVQLPDGKFGVLTSAHVLYGLYDTEGVFQLNKPFFMLLPTIGLVPLCGQQIEPAGYGADQPTIIHLPEEIQDLLNASQQSIDAVIYPYFDPLKTSTLNQGEVLLRFNHQKNVVEAMEVTYIDSENGQLYMRPVSPENFSNLETALVDIAPNVELLGDPFVAPGHSGQVVWQIGNGNKVTIAGTIHGYSNGPQFPIINQPLH